MAVERSIATLLHWSWWRRWHQAWARYHHYRRRLSAVDVQAPLPAPTLPLAKTHADEADVVWRRLEDIVPANDYTGRPYGHDRREVLEAIIYVMRTNCGWQHLPSDFPPWQTVYSQFVRWRKAGIWEAIWEGLDQPRPPDR